MGDKEYLLVFYTLVLNAIEDFQPDYIFVSTGQKKYHWTGCVHTFRL